MFGGSPSTEIECSKTSDSVDLVSGLELRRRPTTPQARFRQSHREAKNRPSGSDCIIRRGLLVLEAPSVMSTNYPRTCERETMYQNGTDATDLDVSIILDEVHKLTPDEWHYWNIRGNMH